MSGGAGLFVMKSEFWIFVSSLLTGFSILASLTYCNRMTAFGCAPGKSSALCPSKELTPSAAATWSHRFKAGNWTLNQRR